VLTEPPYPKVPRRLPTIPTVEGVDSARGTTLGEVINDRRKGRASESEVTVYKAMGIAMEDMVAANLAYRAARREGGGVSITW
jgi:ornithine cyclodeaminase/alanine dehydrogenase-like protein (mu-crystallin family)